MARYAESTGPSRNIPYPHAWKYRDYVIDAVNADVPFDRFVSEQVAGDLLPASSPAERDRLLIATGFLALGVKDVNQRFKVRFVMDNVDEQIDVVSRSVLGLTVTLRPLPRPQVRPDPDHGLLRPGRDIHQHRQLRGVPQQDGRRRARILRPVDARAGSRARRPPPPEQDVEGLKAKVDEAKKAWDAIRGTPEGLAKGPNGVPKQRPLSREVRKATG